MVSELPREGMDVLHSYHGVEKGGSPSLYGSFRMSFTMGETVTDNATGRLETMGEGWR